MSLELAMRLSSAAPWAVLATLATLSASAPAPGALAVSAALGAVVGTTLRASAPRRVRSGWAVARRDTLREFQWSGHVDAGRWVRVRDLSGTIRVERAAGPQVEIRGHKTGRGDLDRVTIDMQRTGASEGDVLVCARWDETTRCDDHGYSSHSHRRWSHHGEDDVAVDFTVMVPPGVKVLAATVNGDVSITGATDEVDAESVNGRVDASTQGGPVRATSVNGAVAAQMHSVANAGRLEYSSVNGSVRVTLPADLKATVDLETVNGAVSSDFPISVSGTVEPQHLRGTIAGGGLPLHIETVNGSVELRKAN